MSFELLLLSIDHVHISCFLANNWLTTLLEILNYLILKLRPIFLVCILRPAIILNSFYLQRGEIILNWGTVLSSYLVIVMVLFIITLEDH